MAKPGRPRSSETPITANFREGIERTQYFIRLTALRKGLADTAMG